MESRAKGITGMPGMRATTPDVAETMPRLMGFMANCVTSALSVEPSTPALDTRKPAAIEMIRAGLWVTRPSPIVMRV